jgi:hypothetical protein
MTNFDKDQCMHSGLGLEDWVSGEVWDVDRYVDAIGMQTGTPWVQDAQMCGNSANIKCLSLGSNMSGSDDDRNIVSTSDSGRNAARDESGDVYVHDSNIACEMGDGMLSDKGGHVWHVHVDDIACEKGNSMSCEKGHGWDHNYVDRDGPYMQSVWAHVNVRDYNIACETGAGMLRAKGDE